jgi:carboxypeptidase Q
MKRSTILLAVLLTAALAAQTGETVDAAAIAKIRDEGLNRSRVMETMFWLTDRYGPRLTGSTEFEEAGDWAVKQLQDWGVVNVRKERFQFGRGWSLAKFHATMTEPRVMPIIGMPKAWTRGTNGTVTADVVRVVITDEADAAKYKGQLRGKIVLTQPVREVRMLDRGPVVLRYGDHPKWLEEVLSVPAPAGRGGGAGAAGGGRGRGNAFNVNQFYKDEGVLALFDRGANSDLSAGGSDLTWQTQRVDGGTVFVQSGGRAGDAPDVNLPQVTLAVEHYNRMVRLLEHSVPVKVELNVEVKFREEAQPGGFNVVGEIPGTDKADEIVLIGAHFDSWHGATGATDNASGSAAMMEVMRIIKATGLRPRRTIRIGLWGAEENGLIGSRVYARDHLGTAPQRGGGAGAAGDPGAAPVAATAQQRVIQDPKPELAKTSVYFNIDNGTGKIRGVWLQGNMAVKPIFEVWIRPLKDLGVDLLGPRSVASTDHTNFDALGIPAFQFIQERYEYNSRTHHSNMDFLDRVQAEDMKQVATVAAVFAWQAATRAELLPRKQ